MAKYDTILDTIGNTPLVRLGTLAPPGVNVFAKLESFNPLGSVKDRMARAVIEAAERDGTLQPGQTVVEATSGNTGIGLAMVCARKGYPLVVVMAENFSIERRKLLRFLGAKVVLTPAAEKGSGMLAKAVELAQAHGWYLCRQFENPANAEVHMRTTAREILADFPDGTLQCFVTGTGTGGTLLGVGRVLKATDPRIRIVVAEPDNAPILASGIPQAREADGRPSRSHPHFQPHLIQGWTPDFIPRLTQTARDEQLIDEIVPIAGADALRLARELATREGILAGPSSGATLAAALQVAQRSAPGTNIVCMLPDTGERYMSTPLFEHIRETMDDDEIAISRSTPGCRFDPPKAAACAVPVTPAPATEALDARAEAFVAQVIGGKPVVLFALEWCEFCWAVRKLLARLGIEYESVDLDSVEFQKGDLGVKIRAVLRAHHAPTIPQIFIGGQRIGGCTELFDAMRSGEMQRRLDAAGVRYDKGIALDPYTLLPNWVHPREPA
ncbi:Cysteine synthase [Lysobacter dokdonensis DS-58]|uniref:cysteine synthase n=2 Tax=Noviluteimonas TaxID=3382693 RepID=A0A0A2WFY3_9GAMM|nr:Cysteine synthase [Lysobacter dokdonensis DS-58]